MKFNLFTIEKIPRVLFGEGQIKQVPSIVSQYGHRTLLITGKNSFSESKHGAKFLQSLAQANIEFKHVKVENEPTPTFIDRVVCEHKGTDKNDLPFDVVIAIGGGSVLDAGKSMAGLLPNGHSIMDHLEEVGRNIPYTGPSLPFIAIPTTAGTGSEATRNAVISHQGADGFKKSFRHDLLVPDFAIIDPQLYASCPTQIAAACGMDALTQLIESYVSNKANPFTDALAVSGIQAIGESLLLTTSEKNNASLKNIANAHAAMAYAALLSGITLAHAGLGIVHGLASPLGTYFPIPHGVACGSILASATRTNIKALQERMPTSVALEKYVHVATLLTDQESLQNKKIDCERSFDNLTKRLSAWTQQLKIPRLGSYGVTKHHLERIVLASSMKNNPISLDQKEIENILLENF